MHCMKTKRQWPAIVAVKSVLITRKSIPATEDVKQGQARVLCRHALAGGSKCPMVRDGLTVIQNLSVLIQVL